MNFKPLPLEDAYLIFPDPFKDHRGLFERIYCAQELKTIGHTKMFAQINHSITAHKGAIRGMHFQRPPKAEIKIVKCLVGAVFDVMVDLRRVSSTFGKWHGETLSADNMKMMYIPEGFAHGFQALEEHSELLYLHTESYSAEHEGGVRFDDPSLGIDWPLPVTDISERDRGFPLLKEPVAGSS